MMHVDKVSVTFLLDNKKLNRFISYFKTSSSYGWVFFFTDTHTKLPSTVIRQIM